MRFKITFKLPLKKQVLPLNYQYPVSAWIYKVLANNDRQFAQFLHEEGYKMENEKTFKLFTFSNLQFPANSTHLIKGTDRLEIKTDKAWMVLAFQIPVAAEKFIAGLFQEQKAEIGDRINKIEMEVGTIEMLKEPEIEPTMTIRALSPVVVTRETENDLHEQYLKPGDTGYETLFFKNLIDKHHAYTRETHQESSDIDPELLSFRCLTQNPHSRLQVIKAHTDAQVKVRGYLFDFEIAAPPALIKTGMDSGFGAMNAMGFGCGDILIINKNDKQ